MKMDKLQFITTIKRPIIGHSYRYSSILYKGEEIGFYSDPSGLFLRLQDTTIPTGVFSPINIGEPEKTHPLTLRKIQRLWPALYDRYNLTVRGK